MQAIDINLQFVAILKSLSRSIGFDIEPENLHHYNFLIEKYGFKRATAAAFEVFDDLNFGDNFPSVKYLEKKILENI